MARRRKTRKKRKSTFLTLIVFLILIIFAVLIANSIMDGKLLQSLKLADEKKAEEKKQIEVDKTDEEDEKIEVDKKDDVFVKKEDQTSFKLVDKTTDEEIPSTEPITEERKKTEKEREALAIQVVKDEWYGGDEPKNPKEYFSLLNKKTDNIYVIEVRDILTTRLMNKYEVNVLKKEIVNII